MRTAARALLIGALALAVACGEDGGAGGGMAAQPTPEPSAEPSSEKPASGTRITLRDSEFGTMLFGPGRQAIYVFERDSEGRSACYGECAKAWPPVFTKGRPRAGRGVRARLLGTTRRRNGRRQVTYAGRPLYFYAHEGPGEVLCHDVDLNGGFWWVVGPDGRRRP
jgi:predicted lipoprotein with Yx(FWY)xxD motif